MPAGGLGLVLDGVEDARASVDGRSSDQEPDEGQVLELPLVLRRQVGVEPAAVGPAAGQGELAGGQPEPRLLRPARPAPPGPSPSGRRSRWRARPRRRRPRPRPVPRPAAPTRGRSGCARGSVPVCSASSSAAAGSARPRPAGSTRRRCCRAGRALAGRGIAKRVVAERDHPPKQDRRRPAASLAGRGRRRSCPSPPVECQSRSRRLERRAGAGERPLRPRSARRRSRCPMPRRTSAIARSPVRSSGRRSRARRAQSIARRLSDSDQVRSA